MSNLIEQRDSLLQRIRRIGDCAVAFSGGVDSTVLAKAAFLAVGDRAIAITGVSASLAEGQLEAAQTLARLIGIRHEIIATEEFAQPEYLQNDGQRCYHCKSELYRQMESLALRTASCTLLNGANADDLADYRPGLRAAGEHQVISPLADCGLNKADVRALAAHWNLPNAQQPASPCLSSRVAYGEPVTPQRLAMIDRAEQFLRQLGLATVRVRYHGGDVARIEAAIDDLPRLCAPEIRQPLVDRFMELGFKFVTLDLGGFRSGSLNVLVPLETRLEHARQATMHSPQTNSTHAS